MILGAEGGTYYVAERDLVQQNHDALVRCIQADGIRAVNRIVEISKRDPDRLALQVLKCQQRDRWPHGDLLRLAHPKAPNTDHEVGRGFGRPFPFPFGLVSSPSVVTGAVLRVGRSTLRLNTASVLNRPW